ncbi:MAG: hypothetical protein CVU50_03420 [Candidatus Cloacimonetes bacterium HGW-Cloacimonetes-3]|jgi:hypothetical protein|nr:MAG: hypothetical protein CVU50_03420 [Candidatus Cloacimonetes bacterium HGW-Cloacimonetes-3]
MKKLIIISLILIQSVLLLAVFDDYQPSARARGMGNAYTAVADDANALFYNPAGLTSTRYGVKFGFANLFNQEFSEYKTLALGAQLPAKLGTIAVGARVLDVDFEDFTLMSEQVWSIGHGITLIKDIHSEISFGYVGNFYNLSMNGEEDDTAIGLDVGVLALLHGRTKFGFSVTNINKAKMGRENQIDLPNKLALGISYTPYDRVTTSIEIKKDFAHETEFMGGVEARIFEPLALRFGVHQNPATYNAGASFYIENIEVDYTYTHHSVLEGTHYFNLGYKF